MIQLNIDAKLYDLATAYPEIVELMDELGFHEIKMPGMLQTAGRMATIPMGAKMKHIDWEEIVRVFAENGFEFVSSDTV
ncbi:MULTISPECIES: DUF1858 domain-containing protein [Lactococcus]|uniref:DUF1858 domain-containing protein n=2 Tax=Lactococcus TaxID=1357 RepID=A0A387BI24_9LACT|nr:MULTISPECIES: DUF1858 domain-containing protein [Lactococcus]AYG00667.1 DUF1858 domain-containing protein [Lactococcus allomyrinae]MCL2112543.1 DUF1858 domain-containing protein [Streptococcaceae bacterium]QDK71605.1 DUF1858 domain-containing protein [Lactococcus protaetiae]